MRGRTNIGGGGIAINATVEQKTIKSGNIIAGDFVEYFSEKQKINQNANCYFKFNISEYSVALRDYAVVIFKNGQITSAYTGNVIYKICKYNNLILFLAYENDKYIIGVLKIQNDQLVYVDSVETGVNFNASTINREISICAGNGKVVIVGIKKYYSNPQMRIYAGYVCDIANDGTLSNGAGTNFPTSEADAYVWSNNDTRKQIAIVYNDGHFRAVSLVGEGNIYELTIDSNNSITPVVSGFQQFISSSTTVSNIGELENIAGQFGNLIVFTSGYYSGYITLNIISGAVSNILVDGHASTVIDQGRFITTEVSENGSFSFYNILTVRLYSYNELTNSIELLDTFSIEETDAFAPVNSNAYRSCINETTHTVYAVTYKSNNYPFYIYLFKVVNRNNIENFSDINYVISYAGEGNPIGVAKDSGAVNDIIGVYIPAAST